MCMSRSQNTTGRTSSVPAGLAAGALVSAGVTGLGTALIAFGLSQERVSWETVGYGILIMILLSAYLGAMTAYSKIRRQKLAVCVMSGMAYWGLLLLITALFFGGQYEAVGVTGLLVTGGIGCAVVTGTGQGRSNRKGKPRIRYR